MKYLCKERELFGFDRLCDWADFLGLGFWFDDGCNGDDTLVWIVKRK